jgi:hypothetical protein
MRAPFIQTYGQKASSSIQRPRFDGDFRCALFDERSSGLSANMLRVFELDESDLRRRRAAVLVRAG